MGANSTGNSNKSGRSKTSTALKAPAATAPITLNDNGQFVLGNFSLSGYTSPTNQVAVVTALSIPVLGQRLSKDHELTLKANLMSLISARPVSAPRISDASAQYVFSGFNGAADVITLFDASKKTVELGISSHKITNEVQFKATISRGIVGHVATENSTLAVVIPMAKGEVNANVSVTNGMISSPKVSVGVSFRLGH